jgi:hypothetical protein
LSHLATSHLRLRWSPMGIACSSASTLSVVNVDDAVDAMRDDWFGSSG